MSQAEQDRRVDYIEFLSTDIEETKSFYSEVFGWEFTDYGPDYTSFTDGRLAGGFSVATEVRAGGPLVVLYSTNLAEIETRVSENGGQIVRETFEFPGGDAFTSPIRAVTSWRSGQIDDFEPDPTRVTGQGCWLTMSWSGRHQDFEKACDTSR